MWSTLFPPKTDKLTNIKTQIINLLLATHLRFFHRMPLPNMRPVRNTITSAKPPTRRQQWKKAFAGVIIIALCGSLGQAANATDSTRYIFDIPAQQVEQALSQLAEHTGHQLLFSSELVNAHHSNAVSGEHTVSGALQQLLQSTPLTGNLTERGVIIVSDPSAQNQSLKGRGKMETTTKKKLLASMVGLFAAGGVATATAQDAVGESARAQNVLDEIIVTAEKREASLQDVPISISAFSGSQLEQSGITGTLDLEMVTPGLSFESSTRDARIFIRGIGSTRLTGPAADPSASTYVDGVYQTRFDNTLVEMMDLERVEVLKGPQGTLYGRNSTGGAIKYISKKPGTEFGGNLKAEVGNYNLRTLTGVLNAPLIEDKLLMRASLMKKDRDGYTDIINLSGQSNDRDDLLAGRLTLQYMPSDSIDVVFHAAAVNDTADAAAYKQTVDSNSGAFTAVQIISDPRKVLAESENDLPGKSRIYDVTLNWDLNWAQLTSITGYTDTSFGPYAQDFDSTELRFWAQGRPATDTNPVRDGAQGNSQVLSQEITLASTANERLDWTIGVFYLEEDVFWLSGFDIAAIPLFASRRGVSNIEAYAAFGDATYALTDKLKLNAGIRYSSETKQYSQRTENIGTVGGIDIQTIGAWVDQEESWSDWTPKVGLNYSISDDVMAYISVSKGFKSGGFNFTGGNAVDPEEITAYEVGLKSMLLDGRLRVNASAFDYDYKDLQVQSFDTVTGMSFLTNAAVADISGLEVAATALLSESFQVDVGLSFLDAEYGDFIKKDPSNPDPAAIINLSGNKLPQAPEFTASIGLSHSHTIDGIGILETRLDYYYSEEKFFDDFNNPLAVQKSYELINLRIGFESQDGTWDVALFGKNLTDELVASSIITAPPFGDEGFISVLNPPRTYGLSVAYNF